MGHIGEKRSDDFVDPKKIVGHASAAADLVSRALRFVLSVIAGYTDIIGFLGLNWLFTAHITGNFVVLVAHIVAGDPTIFSYVRRWSPARIAVHKHLPSFTRNGAEAAIDFRQ